MRHRRAIVFGPLLVWAAARRGGTRAAMALPLAPIPACGDPAGGRPAAETEGPYFKPRSPGRTSLLEPGRAGPRLMLLGHVLTPDCRPIAGALLDFWQAELTTTSDTDAVD